MEWWWFLFCCNNNGKFPNVKSRINCMKREMNNSSPWSHYFKIQFVYNNIFFDEITRQNDFVSKGKFRRTIFRYSWPNSMQSSWSSFKSTETETLDSIFAPLRGYCNFHLWVAIYINIQYQQWQKRRSWVLRVVHL